MKIYHILWFNDDKAVHSTGKNYEADSMFEALALFYEEYPDKEPFAIFDKAVKVIGR